MGLPSLAPQCLSGLMVVPFSMAFGWIAPFKVCGASSVLPGGWPAFTRYREKRVSFKGPIMNTGNIGLHQKPCTPPIKTPM